MRARVGTAAILLAGAALLGCGGGGQSPDAPTGGLTAVNRLAILQQVVSATLGGVPFGPPAARSHHGPFGGLVCEKSCDESTCVVTCPIEERRGCPAGGWARNTGRIEGTLDVDQTGVASLRALQTYGGCRPNGELSVEGDPDTTASGAARFDRGRLTDEQTVQIRGAVRYASGDGAGRCEVDLTVTFSPRLHGAARGTACGQTVDVPF